MQILCSKYKLKADWLHNSPSKVASPVWKAIESTKHFIIKGVCYLIGDGSSVNIWTDPWVVWLQNFRPKPRIQAFYPIMTSQIINSKLHVWKETLIKELFDPEDVPAILSIPLPHTPRADKLIWVPNSKGVFSIKFAYRSAIHQSLPQSTSPPPWRKIWNLNAPERLKMFLWRIEVNIIPTRENLMKRLNITHSSCVLCGSDLETALHIFFKCPVARAIWHSACWGFKAEEAIIHSTEDIIKLVIPRNINAQIANHGLSL